VLAHGIPLSRSADGSSPRLGLDPLDNAPDHARRVAAALSEFAYEVFPVQPKHTDFEHVIESLMTAPDIAVLIMHLVGHGELADGSSEKLYLLDHEAMRLRHPVSGWIQWIEDHPDRHRPVTLFVLDVCYAGEAAVTAWHARMDVTRRRAWVLAATGPRDKAFGYRLSRALAQVLDRYAKGVLRIDPSVRYIPASTVWRDVESTVRTLTAQEGGLPQTILTSLIPSHADLSELPFFPNPGFVEAGPEERLPPDIARLADVGADPLHFMRRAGGAEPVQRDWREGYFSGRAEDLSRLASWLDDERAGPSLRVITGRPGAGKSALLGMLVCAAHPDLREYTKPLWQGLGDAVPGTNERLAVIHARRLSLQGLVRALSEQVRRIGPPSADSATAVESTGPFFALLQEKHRRSGRPVTIIIDALDESNDPEAITEQLLHPLARRHQELVRLLIATRDDTRVSALTGARTGYKLLDLDATVPEALRDDISLYVKRLLSAAGPYTAGPMRQARNALADAIAQRLADDSNDHCNPLPPHLRLGEFLTAGIYVSFMLSGTQHSPAVEDATRIGHAVPRSLPELLEMDLLRHGEQPLLRSVLTALAFAQGQGMPELVLADVVARDFTGQDRTLPLETLYRLLDNEARLYLSRSVDADGTTLYRIFHQGVADWWRDSASTQDRQRLYRGILASVRRDVQQRPLWHLSPPYIQRHLPQHAADAGSLDQVLEDGDYLVFADPSVLLPLLPEVTGTLRPQAEANAGAYTDAFAERADQPLDVRRQLLATTAALRDNSPLRATLERSADWSVHWASPTASPPTALATCTVQGHLYAVIGTDLGDIEVRDVRSGKMLGPEGRGGRARTAAEVQSLVAVDIEGRPHIVTGSYGALRLWEPLTASPARELQGRLGSVTALTAVESHGRTHLLVGGYGGFGVWDLTDAAQTDELVGHGGWVDAIAVTRVLGRPHVVTGADNGRVQIWDLTARTVVHDLAGRVGWVNAVAITRVQGHPYVVAAGEEGVVHLWDLLTGDHSGELVDHRGDAVTALSVAGPPERPHVVTGHLSGRLVLWDLTARTRSATFRLPSQVTAVKAGSDGFVLVAFENGLVALALDALTAGLTTSDMALSEGGGRW
jgi:type II secretory pathway predicted ATPase ExeA